MNHIIAEESLFSFVTTQNEGKEESKIPPTIICVLLCLVQNPNSMINLTKNPNPKERREERKKERKKERTR